MYHPNSRKTPMGGIPRGSGYGGGYEHIIFVIALNCK